MKSKRNLNVGDEVQFFARVRGIGLANAAVATPYGGTKGRVISLYPNVNFPAWEIEADVMTRRGHVFRVAL